MAPTFSGFVNVWSSSVELLEGQSLRIKFARFIWNKEEYSKRFRDYRNHRLAKVYLNMINTCTKMYWLTRISLSSIFWQITLLVYQKLKATKSFPSSPVRVWIFFSPVALRPVVRPWSPFIEVSRSHSDTPHSVGILPSDQPDAQTSTWQHTTLTRGKHQCPRGAKNLQSLEAVDLRFRPRGHWDRLDIAFSLPKTKWNKDLSWFHRTRGSFWGEAFCIQPGCSQIFQLPYHVIPHISRYYLRHKLHQ